MLNSFSDDQTPNLSQFQPLQSCSPPISNSFQQAATLCHPVPSPLAAPKNDRPTLQKVPQKAPGVLGSELRLPRRVCFFVTTLAPLIHEDGRLAMDDERDAAKGGFWAGTSVEDRWNKHLNEAEDWAS